MSKYRYGKKDSRRVDVSVNMNPASASAFVNTLIKTHTPRQTRKVPMEDVEFIVSDLRNAVSELYSALDEIEDLSETVRYKITSIEDSIADLESLV